MLRDSKSMRATEGDKDVNQQVKSNREREQGVATTPSLPSEEDKEGGELETGISHRSSS